MVLKQGLQAYLDYLGIEEWGTPTQIETAKKTYWRRYHRQYKMKQRMQNPEISIRLSKEQRKKMLAAAKTHNQKLAPFIRQCALAYLDQKFLVPNENLIIEIKEYLATMSYNLIYLRQTATEHGTIELAEAYDVLLDRLSAQERYLQEKLEYPPLIAHHSFDHDHQIPHSKKSKLPTSD